MSAHSQHAFSEKVALVTDGANPVGRAIAMQLALYGAYVIAGFSSSSGSAIHGLNELKALGTLANAVEADIATAQGAEKLISEVRNQYGRLDLLINCQNFRLDSEYRNTTEDDLNEVLDQNFKSVFFAAQYAIGLMEDRPRPKIVNVVSACDSEKSKNDLGYLSANAAVVAFTKGLAVSLPKHFRANVVRVSERDRAVSKFDIPDDELFRKKTGVDPDDVARTVLFLLSPEATGLNGQVLTVD